MAEASRVEPDLVSSAKVELFLKGRVPGIAAWGVPLLTETARLFGIEPEGKERFDFIHLATVEIAEKAKYPEVQESYPDIMTRVLSSKSGNPGQTETLRYLTDIIFYPGNEADAKLFNEMKQTIAQNPDKPFLIIYGHGFSHQKSQSKYLKEDHWYIGEQEMEGRRTDLLDLLKELDNNRYSAILLTACNPGQVGLENKGYKTPIYYKMGTPGTSEKFSQNRAAVTR